MKVIMRRISPFKVCVQNEEYVNKAAFFEVI